MDSVPFYLPASVLGLQIAGLLALYIPAPRLRRVAASVILLMFSVAAGALTGMMLSAWALFFAAGVLFQIINLGRVVENRMHLSYQRRQVARAGLFLVGWSICWYIFTNFAYSTDLVLPTAWLYAFICLVSSTIIAAWTYGVIRKGHFKKGTKFYADDELPTVSVLVPARNEDESLSDCIQSILASDYPKLEIIVLDDCSHDKSSGIIKAFAQDGVRFIQGEMPKENWLAKNQAYETLASASSGSWLIFSGVDVRFSADTIRTLLNHLLVSKLKMCSVLPERSTAKQLHALSPLRYFWEISIPGFFHAHRRPAVLSTFWAIEKKAYLNAGGLEAVSRSVNPEGFFAKKYRETYRFLFCGEALQVMTGKSLKEQYETSIRSAYPELRRRIERTMLACILLLLLFTGPFVGLVFSVLLSEVLLAIVFGIACGLLLFSHGWVSWEAGQVGVLRIIFFPLLAVQETALISLSMFRYEFSEVVWKDRNICYPVMHVVPRLPGLNKK